MASISFPTNPTNGDTYTYNGVTYEFNSTKSQWIIQAGTSLADVNINSIGGSMIPSANVTHDLGTSDKAFRDLYLSGSSINLGDATISSSGSAVTLPAGSTVGGVTIGTGSGGATQYANASLLPTSGLTAGEFAFVGNTLFMTNGTGWYSVALINQSPELTLSTSSISLGNSGNTINFTFTATDPDGPIPTVTLSNSGISNTSVANINLYTSNNTVTVENFSADPFNATITLTASDGINQTFGTVTLTVGYVSELWPEAVLSIGTSSTNSLDNSTFVDRSTNARTVNINGGTPTQTAFHPYLDNWSVDFDGNDYLTFADQSDWDFVNSGDFTVDSWIYPRSNSNISWFGQSGGSGGRSDKWGIYINDTSVGLSAGTIGWHLGNNGNIQGPSFTPTANTWYHIRLGREGDVWYFFVDGVLLGTTTSTIRPAPVAQTLRVGADGEAYRIFDGYLSNFRIVKGTNLSTTTFDDVTENLTAVTNTVLLTCQSNRVVDNSTNNYSATFVGDPVVSAFNPFGQESEYTPGENKGSIFFDATGGLDVTSCTDIGTGDFTFQAWIYPRSVSGTKMIISNRGDGGSIFIGTDGTEFYPYVGGSYKTSGAGLRTYEWAHVAFCRTSGSIETYVNGVKYGTVAQGGDLFGTTGYLIGSGDVGQWDGWIADLQVTTTGQYTGNTYTIPTAPVGTTNADLYLPFDNAGIFDKTGNYTLTLGGDTSTSTTQTKFADTAIYFDGTGDILQIPNPSLDNSNWTVEMWVYQNSAADASLMSQGGSSVSSWSISSSGTFTLQIFRGANFVLISNVGSFQAGQWNHCALVCDGSNFTIYHNGTSVGSTATNASYPWNQGYTTQPLKFGVYDYNSSNYLNGYMENIQILKGVAKYTTNFTPPTITQGRIYQAES